MRLRNKNVISCVDRWAGKIVRGAYMQYERKRAKVQLNTYMK